MHTMIHMTSAEVRYAVSLNLVSLEHKRGIHWQAYLHRRHPLEDDRPSRNSNLCEVHVDICLPVLSSSPATQITPEGTPRASGCSPLQ